MALVLEELIRAYAAEGEAGGIPDTVLAMMQARLDRLPAEARRVLRAASVFGQVFCLPAVQHVLGPSQSPVELARQLDYLVECELCERHTVSRYAGSAEYGFCNQFIREAVYSLLTEEDRARGHRLAGQYQAQAGDAEPRLIFDHLKRGGEYEQAVHYGLLAGDSARRLCSQEEARLIYAEVVELTEELSDAAHHRMLRADALLRFTRCTLAIQAPEATAALLDQVERLLPADASPSPHEPAAQGDGERLKRLRAWLHCLRAQVALFQSDSASVVHHCRITLTLVGPDSGMSTPELVAFPAVALGAALLGQGYCTQAAVLFRQALAALENLNDLSEHIRAQLCLAASLIAQGETQAGWSIFREAELRAQETNQPSVLGTVYHLCAVMHLWMGDWSAALSSCNLAIRKATKSGEQVTLVQCTLTSILAAVQLGDLAIARKSIQAAAMLTRRLGERVLLGQWLTIAQAELATLDGHTEEGIALARLASEQASRLDQPHCVGVAECVLARALAARQPADSAEIDAHMHRSVTTLDAAGLTLEVARTRLHWALLLKRRQPEEPQRANELYNAALTRFRLSDCTQAIAEAERLWSASPAQPAEL